MPVLLRLPVLQRIMAGEQHVVFRRWIRPTVREGGTLKTAVGVLRIGAVEKVAERDITDGDARNAGYASRTELLEDLRERDGELYRIEVRYAGADPRVALRESAELDEAAFRELEKRLQRFDAGKRSAPWTLAVLRLIEARPATLAAQLARTFGQDTATFKRNVRKLKELGLTESLEIGYRLSPRGQAFLTLLQRSSPESAGDR